MHSKNLMECTLQKWYTNNRKRERDCISLIIHLYRVCLKCCKIHDKRKDTFKNSFSHISNQAIAFEVVVLNCIIYRKRVLKNVTLCNSN